MTHIPGSFPRRDFIGAGIATLGMFPLLSRFSWAGDTLALENDAIAARWSVADGALRLVALEDRLGRRPVEPGPDLFAIELADGSVIRSGSLRLSEPPRAGSIAPQPGATRMAQRIAGRELTARLNDPSGRVAVRWRAELRDGSHYIRQEITVDALGQPLAIGAVVVLDLAVPGAQVVGLVKGSPIVAGTFFTGAEHPLADNTVGGARARGVLPHELPLRPGVPLTVSSVIGATAPGQLRRGFLAYLERERARPYSPFLHYNSWYDLGYFSHYDEAGALAVIDAFGTELHQKRGVELDSFLFDDGWDDPATLWHFHSGFPHGFVPLKQEAAKYGAAPGVWLSPWGGYGKPKEQRLQYGKAQGFETNAGGFALSGPKYYQRFREVCLDFIHTAGVNQFKFDGTGNADRAFPGSEFGSDFEAMIHLIGDLRAAKPGLYINLTTGTYPSPWWLWHADSIWRGGEDHEFAGVGTPRQRWITYRDGDTYAGIVERGPLYPLNSLMLHGIIYARSAHDLTTDPGNDFPSEVHDYFGTGTQCQEMYITPSLLSAENWDTLAEGAKWSRRNAGTLVDTHWVGGDPKQLEVYGWAAWSPAGATLTLRNPSDQPQSITLDPAEVFELPWGAAERYSASSPWTADQGTQPTMLTAGARQEFKLKPWEVVTLEGTGV